MSFDLPSDDAEFLSRKQWAFRLETQQLPDGNLRRGLIVPAFIMGANLYQLNGGQLAACPVCELMVLIPKGYATTKLDSFYTIPHLKRADGADPDRASGRETIFEREWQFWSRHLADNEWRPGIDGLETYFQYILAELRKA
jgi:hypothetical protein